jgi:peptidoglycan/xylan/chitin deacetylase (PgdA/CDA1 family)
VSRRLLVLGWHNIDPTPAFPAPAAAGRRGFARQLTLLSRFGNVVRLPDALDALESGRPLPPRAVALTFDDGYRDNLDVAVPALRQHGLPATFFLVPGFLSGEVNAWWEELASAFDLATATELDWTGRRYPLTDSAERRSAYLELLPGLKSMDRQGRDGAVAELRRLLAPRGAGSNGLFLGWDGARELAAAGHDIGSHSVSHAILGRETAQNQAAELDESRARLQDSLQRTVEMFAYPNGAVGDYDTVTTGAARHAGYRAAFTTTAGLAGAGQLPYELRRFVLGPDTDLPGVLRELRWMAQDALRAKLSARGANR